MFLAIPLSIIRSFSLYTQKWYMSYRFADSLRAGSGRNCSSIPILLARCQQTCMTYIIAVCTVQKLLMMDRETVWNMQSFIPKKIWEISAYSWFYYKNLSRCKVTWTSDLLTELCIYFVTWDQTVFKVFFRVQCYTCAQFSFPAVRLKINSPVETCNISFFLVWQDWIIFRTSDHERLKFVGLQGSRLVKKWAINKISQI